MGRGGDFGTFFFLLCSEFCDRMESNRQNQIMQEIQLLVTNYIWRAGTKYA